MTLAGHPGPRSLMRTLTCLPSLALVTSTTLPKGRVRWAAVSLRKSNTSPLDVLLPWCSLP